MNSRERCRETRYTAVGLLWSIDWSRIDRWGSKTRSGRLPKSHHPHPPTSTVIQRDWLRGWNQQGFHGTPQVHSRLVDYRDNLRWSYDTEDRSICLHSRNQLVSHFAGWRRTSNSPTCCLPRGIWFMNCMLHLVEYSLIRFRYEVPHSWSARL